MVAFFLSDSFFLVISASSSGKPQKARRFFFTTVFCMRQAEPARHAHVRDAEVSLAESSQSDKSHERVEKHAANDA